MLTNSLGIVSNVSSARLFLDIIPTKWVTTTAGKTVITAPDRPGFIVNRCARPYYGEALALLDEVTSPMNLKKAMCLLLVVEVDLLPATNQET